MTFKGTWNILALPSGRTKVVPNKPMAAVQGDFVLDPKNDLSAMYVTDGNWWIVK